MSYTDDNLSFALLFEECFYFAEKLQAIIDKNPSDKLAITKIIEQFKEFLTAQNDLTMKKQSNCQDFEHSKLSSYLEDSRKKFLSLSETLENLKVEKDDIKKALKVRFSFFSSYHGNCIFFILQFLARRRFQKANNIIFQEEN